MDRKRPVGVAILAVLMMIGGSFSIISLPFYVISLLGPEPQFSVEKYKSAIFRGRQPSEEENLRFETTMMPQVEKMLKIEKALYRDTTIPLFQFIYMIIGIVGFVFGIGLWKLMEDARLGTIVYQIFSVVIGVFGQYLIMQTTMNISAKYMPEMYQGGMPRSFPMTMVIIQAVIAGIITALIVFYLTRPKVKEWFS
jgi:hypothetical protein